MFKKKEEPEDIRGLMNVGKDYHNYRMTATDRLISFALGFLVGAIVSWAFFSNLIFAAVCGLVCAAFAPNIYRKYRRDRVIESLREQFRDLLDSLSASYSAGKNTTSAFQSSEKDMISIYGEDADIVEEIRIINGGLKNNVNIEALLSDFAQRSGIEDIQSFADVFEVCNRQGGNLKRIVMETRDIINDKIEIEMEIGTMLAGNKNELNIMIVMPVIVVLMLNGFGSGTANANTLSNIVLKVGCIALFGIAYFLGKKLTDIKI